MRPAIVCGIVIVDTRVSYWPVFFNLSLEKVLEVLAKVFWIVIVDTPVSYWPVFLTCP